MKKQTNNHFHNTQMNNIVLRTWCVFGTQWSIIHINTSILWVVQKNIWILVLHSIYLLSLCKSSSFQNRWNLVFLVSCFPGSIPEQEKTGRTTASYPGTICSTDNVWYHKLGCKLQFISFVLFLSKFHC